MDRCLAGISAAGVKVSGRRRQLELIQGRQGKSEPTLAGHAGLETFIVQDAIVGQLREIVPRSVAEPLRPAVEFSEVFSLRYMSREDLLFQETLRRREN